MPEQIELSIGHVFTIRARPGLDLSYFNKAVVTQVDPESFGASPVFNVMRGYEEASSPGGSFTPDEIDRIICRWDLETLMNALKRGFHRGMFQRMPNPDEFIEQIYRQGLTIAYKENLSRVYRLEILKLILNPQLRRSCKKQFLVYRHVFLQSVL